MRNAIIMRLLRALIRLAKDPADAHREIRNEEQRRRDQRDKRMGLR